MNRLIETIAFTPDVGRMKQFYEHGVGLATTYADPHWTSFDTAGVTLALHPLEGAHERGIGLTFESTDLDADIERLRGRGIELSPVYDEPYGRGTTFHDPEGNLIGLRQSRVAAQAGRGRPLGTVILNCRNLRGTVAFYHETLLLPATWEGEHWVELDAGAARLALHLRPAGNEHPLHAEQKIACCFDAPELEGWIEEMRGRGLSFATAPTEEEWGLYAEAIDPDGNVVVFRVPRESESLEEQLAEPFESDKASHSEGMRKPVRKAAGGASRLALRPAYRAKKKAAARRGVTEPRHRAAAEGKRRSSRVASPRGTGPAGSRKKPKTRKDVKRAKAKPATGRKKKAEESRRTLQRRAVAGASKTRRVKRAAPRPSRGRRR